MSDLPQNNGSEKENKTANGASQPEKQKDDSLSALFAEAEEKSAATSSGKKKISGFGSASGSGSASHAKKAHHGTDKRTLLLIITIIICIVALIAVLTVGFVELRKLSAEPESTAPGTEISGNLPTVDIQTTTPVSSGNESSENSADSAKESENTDKPVVNNGTTVNAEVSKALEDFTLPAKSGDNVLSDSPNNEFIALIHKKYFINEERLVAIYATPDKGNNFVLQFNGTLDEAGDVIKSPDTLEVVYQIDLNRNVTVATGKRLGNIGVSFAESYIAFQMVKTVIMPQYPDYFTGV